MSSLQTFLSQPRGSGVSYRGGWGIVGVHGPGTWLIFCWPQVLVGVVLGFVTVIVLVCFVMREWVGS